MTDRFASLFPSARAQKARARRSKMANVNCMTCAAHAQKVCARRSKMADINHTTCAASALSRLCPHCNRWLSCTAFNEHRALYFHKDASSWKREANVHWLLRKQQLLSSYLASHAQDIIYDGYVFIIWQNNHSHS